MALTGKYEFVKDEGQLQHLLATGLPEEHAKKFLENTSLEISINGNDVTISRGKGPVQKLVLNQEVTESFPNGGSLTSTASLSGNDLKIVSSGKDRQWTRTYSLSGSELTVTSQAAGAPDGKRFYKKL